MRSAQIGDRVVVVINGKRFEFYVSGVSDDELVLSNKHGAKWKIQRGDRLDTTIIMHQIDSEGRKRLEEA